MTGFDLSTITDCYIGSTQASEIYYGATKIWPAVDYSQEYLTIEPLANGTLTFTKNATSGDLYYSNDKQNWITYSSSISLTNGHDIYLKGDMTPYSQGPITFGIGILRATSNINVSGNIMSLLYGDNFIGQTSLSGKSYAFYNLFRECTGLIRAENMSLPATTLTQSCYTAMFYSCSSLTTAPQLPATTLARNCYSSMFEYCTSLTTAPLLPATTLAHSCYSSMFSGCSSLTTAPVLPVTTLTTRCYQNMFDGCSSLTTAPQLPATTLTDYCYSGMFGSCSSLTTAPVLPATTLAEHCYSYMFSGCSSLTAAPVLPVTTLAQHCYQQMFAFCVRLTTAPVLPATTLAQYCYSSMFEECSSLTTAPELPANILVDDCYYEMFWGCTSLNEVHCDATDITATDCLTNWLSGVSPTGDFYKPSTTTYPSGASGIPSGWTIHSTGHDYSQDYLTLEALEAGTFTWTDTNNSRSISYSTDDGSTWTTLTSGSTTLSIAANSKVLLKATLGAGSSSGNGTISSSGRFNIMGNIMSLVGGDNFNNLTTISNSNQFSLLFRNCTKVIDASNLILPATTLSIYCYYNMFNGCTSLTAAPSVLPATTLKSNCYQHMFNGCTSLTIAPSLPATTLAMSCYGNMFRNCTSLTTAPELPATTLANFCYDSMFYGCTSLTTTPTLRATTLTMYCYSSMFRYCSSLNCIKCLATDISASGCTSSWVDGVASSGTFFKDPFMTSWTRGNNGIPTGWTVEGGFN